MLETIAITSLAHDGRGIGFLANAANERGLAVFVSGALPGQVVRCRVRHRSKRFLEAELLEVLACDFSPEAPICPHEACGGCGFKTFPYYLQLLWKEKLAQNALQRIGKIPADLVASARLQTSASPQLRHFRNKATFAFGLNADGQFELGFRSRDSHQIVGITRCAIVPPEAMTIVAYIREAAGAMLNKGLTKADFWKFLTLRHGMDEKGQWGWRVIFLTRPGAERVYAAIANLLTRILTDLPLVQAAIHQIRSRKDLLAQGEKTITAVAKEGAADVMALPLVGIRFQLPVQSFFQVNLGAANALVQAAWRLDQECARTLLDLYCGVGAPGQFLGERHKQAYGIEVDGQAIACAKVNAAAANLSQWHYQGGAARSLIQRMQHKKINFGTVLLDPPRMGAGAEVMTAIGKLHPDHIIYISCDSPTLARDMALLGNDFELVSWQLVDMFPHTPHGEICSLWKNRHSS